MAEPADLDVPWTRSAAASRVRELLVCGVLGPLMDLYTRRRVTRRELLDDLTGPVVFVANHNSHMDTPLILRTLPGRWRRRTAVAAATDYFYAKRRNAVSASFVFGTVPLDRSSGAGVGPGQTAHLDRLIAGGGSLLVFPEGTRSRDGRVGRLRSGAALLAAEHGVPIVPIYLSGTRQAMPRGHHWMVFKTGRPGPRHPLEIRFGKPIVPRPGEPPGEVMERFRLFLAECGAETEGGPDAEREPEIKVGAETVRGAETDGEPEAEPAARRQPA
jgi:1-acyl-sn-glycerol-3-phosphate acyltransferase